MSTDYKIQLRAPDGTTSSIKIIDSIIPLPGSDTWTADVPASIGATGGTVASWGSGNAILSSAGGPNFIVLEGFSKQTNVGDEGNGEKNEEIGTFPAGTFRWRCTAKN